MKIALLTDRFMVGGGLEYLYRIAAGLPQHTFVICAHGGPAAARFHALPNVVIETATALQLSVAMRQTCCISTIFVHCARSVSPPGGCRCLRSIPSTAFIYGATNFSTDHTIG